MTLASALVNIPMKFILHTFLQVDTTEVKKIPMQGPLILATNHINMLDAPAGFTHLYPRPLSAFAKSEFWRNPAIRLLFKVWNVIPLHRGEVDFDAFALAQAELEKGKIMLITPEGTRSHSGSLAQGLPGVVLLAVRSGAPILPVAFYGNENVKENLKHLRRTPLTYRVGEPFTVNTENQAFSREFRQQVTDEIMYQIAALLPEQYRGVYSDLSKASTNHLRFLSTRNNG